MKNAVTGMACVVLLLLLSAASRSMMAPQFLEEDTVEEFLQCYIPGPVNLFVYRISCDLLDESGRCLVFMLEVRNLAYDNERLNLQVDLFIHCTGISRDRTITKQVTISY